MNLESENFEALRKVIALKRYEQPPPGYFQRLPGVIIARIEQEPVAMGWWQRVTSYFVMRPAMTCALGMAACGVIALDVVWTKTAPKDTLGENTAAVWETVRPSALADNAPYNPTEPLHVANWLKNTNPSAIQEAPSLFAPVGQRSIETEFVPGH